MPLTLEEQERRAYISGDVELAQALAGQIDGESDAVDEVDEVEHELRVVREDLKAVTSERDILEEELEEAQDRIENLERELDEAHEIARNALTGESS